jgi:hypothetical protein
VSPRGCILRFRNSAVQTFSKFSAGENIVNRRTLTLIVIAVTAVGFIAGATVASRIISVQAQTKPGYGAAALAGERVGQDVDGPYQVDPNWPKPITALPATKNGPTAQWKACSPKIPIAFSFWSAVKFQP